MACIVKDCCMSLSLEMRLSSHQKFLLAMAASNLSSVSYRGSCLNALLHLFFYGSHRCYLASLTSIGSRFCTWHFWNAEPCTPHRQGSFLRGYLSVCCPTWRRLGAGVPLHRLDLCRYWSVDDSITSRCEGSCHTCANFHLIVQCRA